MNLDNILIEKVVGVNTSAYLIRLSNLGNVSVSGCVVQNTGENSDGVHVDGPSNDISISNCTFSTGDDSIALNCPEGYTGDISRVTVSGCTFNSWSLMRLYTALDGYSPFNVDTVTVTNCTGALTEQAFVLGWEGSARPNTITGFTISNCNLTAPAVLGACENFGSIALNNVTWIPHTSEVYWLPPQLKISRTCGFLRPSPTNGQIRFSGSSLYFENCIVQRHGGTPVSAVVLEIQSSISSVEFNGFSIQDTGSAAAIQLLNLDAGTIGELIIDSMYMENVDLCRRIGSRYKTVFYPHISIVHGYARASYVDLRPMGYHVHSAMKYFTKWSWFRDDEREALNQRLSPLPEIQ